MAGRTGIRRQPRPGALGAGRGRRTVTVAYFSDDGRPALCACLTSVERIQLATRLGLRSPGYSRVPAAAERRQPGEPGARDTHGSIDGAVRPACACRLALV